MEPPCHRRVTAVSPPCRGRAAARDRRCVTAARARARLSIGEITQLDVDLTDAPLTPGTFGGRLFGSMCGGMIWCLAVDRTRGTVTRWRPL